MPRNTHITSDGILAEMRTTTYLNGVGSRCRYSLHRILRAAETPLCDPSRAVHAEPNEWQLMSDDGGGLNGRNGVGSRRQRTPTLNGS